MSRMSSHEYDKQSRVPTAYGRLCVQGTSYVYVGATKERVKCATEEFRHQKTVVMSRHVMAMLRV